ncbi:MAG: hypothetical protein K0R67_3890, partial [Paenibacillus sp.]|nr:hypothetical protein [Paenibacillus sp.]
MKQPDENQMFDWVDQLKLKQEHVRQEVPMTGAAKDLNESEGAALRRIQSLTFAKLGLEQPERLVTTSHSAALNDDVPAVQFIRTRKNVQRRWALAAALAGVIIVSAFSLLSPEVRAQVRKVIQFL